MFQPTEHTPNEASQALKQWRLSQKNDLGKQKFPSGRGLADWITKKIKEKEPGAKLIVYQPDVSKAERGWPGPLEKVITALYNYCEVTPGFFGELEYTSPEINLPLKCVVLLSPKGKIALEHVPSKLTG